jgi:peptidoglycan/LPS O-acetylase OafA/YrhL
MLSYWSLGFEVWYYIAFGLTLFIKGPMRIASLLAWAIAVGPMIFMMLPLWLLGAVAYRLGNRIRLEPYRGAAAWALSLALWTVYEARIRRYVPVMQAMPPQLANVLDDYIVGGLFAVNVTGFRAMSGMVARIVDPVAPLIRYAAGATFTIYLLHIPVAQFLTTFINEPPSTPGARIVIFGGTLAALFLIACVTERRKQICRNGIQKIYVAAVRFERKRRSVEVT